MNLVDALAMAVLLQYVFFAVLVGRARVRTGLKAPAVTGNEEFERHYRVQMNTLELLVPLLPAAYASARYWPPTYVAATLAVFLIGRFLYWRLYVANPKSRAPGFMLSIAPVVVLVIAAFAGALTRTA
jgi:hypothetical protein